MAWTVTSDARDKADVVNSTYGLDFINSLRPVTFVWDERTNYENGISDGSKKGTKRQIGFLSQEVIKAEIDAGTPQDNLLVADNEEDNRLKITETKFIPALVKAIQELKAEVDSLKQQLGK